MAYQYVVISRCYIGHTLMVSPRQGADPIPTVINQLLDPGYVKGPDGKETTQRAMYVQCGREDCQCSVPLTSTALEPANEETKKAVAEQKKKQDALRRAAQNGNDPLALRTSVAELALENEKLRRHAAEMELENTKLRLAALENAKPAQQTQPRR